MTFGMPTPMFLVFVAVILAGSLGALHYVVVHVLMGRPFADEVGGTTTGGPGSRPGADPDRAPTDPTRRSGAPEWPR